MKTNSECEDDTKWKNNKTQRRESLLSATDVSTKAPPPCVCAQAIVGHYIYVIMEWMKVLFYCTQRGSLFSFFIVIVTDFSSSHQHFPRLSSRHFFPFSSTSSAHLLRLLVCRKYSYQQLMLFAICTNIYIKRTTRKKIIELCFSSFRTSSSCRLGVKVLMSWGCETSWRAKNSINEMKLWRSSGKTCFC